MTVLTRDQILEADDLKRELVPVPEWGGDVYVRALTGEEFTKLQKEVSGADGKKLNLLDVYAKLCALSICDEDGKLLFGEKDIPALNKKSSAALKRVFMVAQRLSGFGDEEFEHIQQELEKDPFAASPSA